MSLLFGIQDIICGITDTMVTVLDLFDLALTLIRLDVVNIWRTDTDETSD